MEGIELNGKKFAGLREITAPCPFCNEGACLDLAELVKMKEGERINCKACGKPAFAVKKFEIGSKPDKVTDGENRKFERNKSKQEIRITLAILGEEIKAMEVDGKKVKEEAKPVERPADPFLAITDAKYCTKGNDLVEIPWEPNRAIIVGKVKAGLGFQDDDGEIAGEFDIETLEGKKLFTVNFDGARFLPIEGISPAFKKDKKKARDWLLSGKTNQEPWQAWGKNPIKIRVNLATMTLINLSTQRLQCHYVPDLLPALNKVAEFTASQMPEDGHGGIATAIIINQQESNPMLISMVVDVGDLDESKEAIKIYPYGFLQIGSIPVKWNLKHRAFSIRHQGLQKMGEAIKNMIAAIKELPQALKDAEVSPIELGIAKKMLSSWVETGWITRQQKIIGSHALEQKKAITVFDLLKLVPYLDANEGLFGEIIWKFRDKVEWVKFTRHLEQMTSKKQPVQASIEAEPRKEDEDLTGLD